MAAANACAESEIAEITVGASFSHCGNDRWPLDLDHFGKLSRNFFESLAGYLSALIHPL